MLELAASAAGIAGEYLRNLPAGERRVSSVRGRDVKLEADLAAEDLIRAELRSNSGFEILGEEQGFEQRGASDYTWIVDPLDGTFNYLRGTALCCVSIGLFSADLPRLGAVYDFNRDEMFTGIVGVGAWKNGESMYASGLENRDKAALATGFPVDFDFGGSNVERYAVDFNEYKKVRMIGSAALSLAYVASGRFDVYREESIRIWDVAAGLALVLAAGGRYRLDGYPGATRVDVIAGGSCLMSQIDS
ncbi:hypothetical protein JYT20_00750 [Rhodothermus sp. AH-315-K08]|nr:hypothetical protein [Rhodothermus sp. AH-315-K08]